MYCYQWGGNLGLFLFLSLGCANYRIMLLLLVIIGIEASSHNSRGDG